MERKLIGVDLGGTTTKFAILTENGDIQQKWSIETTILDKDCSPAAVLGFAMIEGKKVQNQFVGADNLQVHCQGLVLEPDARGVAPARKEKA